jgi:uncharacterized protein YciI
MHAHIPDKKVTEDIIKKHIDHLKDLDENGQLVLAGPFLDRTGGMVIIKAASFELAKKIVESDPFITNGVQSYQLKEMNLACKDNNYLSP